LDFVCFGNEDAIETYSRLIHPGIVAIILKHHGYAAKYYDLNPITGVADCNGQ
jgi:hypothetical protein